MASVLQRRYRASDATPGLARQHIATYLHHNGQAELIPSAALAVSELMTNAVIYAGGSIELRARIDGPRLHVEVADDSDALPHLRDFGFGGYGLQIVDALATTWGANPIRDDGKVTWFDLEHH